MLEILVHISAKSSNNFDLCGAKNCDYFILAEKCYPILKINTLNQDAWKNKSCQQNLKNLNVTYLIIPALYDDVFHLSNMLIFFLYKGGCILLHASCRGLTRFSSNVKAGKITNFLNDYHIQKLFDIKKQHS